MPHPQRLRDDSIPALATAKREFSLSAALAERIVLGAISPQPLSTTTCAKYALIDWFDVAIGESAGPLVGDVLEEGTQGSCRLLGRVPG